jgi:hypothetical protein
MTSLSWLRTSPLGGVVSVVFTAVISPIVLEVEKRRIADGALYRVRATRATALAGVWIGKGLDSGSTSEENFDFNVRLSLKYRNFRVVGKGELSLLSDLEKAGMDFLDFEGSFHNENFMQLSYRNPAVGPVQLGVALFRLSDVGTELKGIYAGYSPLRGQLASGTLMLTKGPS